MYNATNLFYGMEIWPAKVELQPLTNDVTSTEMPCIVGHEDWHCVQWMVKEMWYNHHV